VEELIKKAEILIEALPYIRKFCGSTFVIKYGGAVQKEEKLKDAFAQDVVLLEYIGINIIIVHGGGIRVSEIMKKMGKIPKFVHGQRVTDEETIDIVEMVLGGLVNKEIVTLINNHGGAAVGLTGKDGSLIMAKKKVLKTPLIKEIDIGLVGEVDKVNPDVLLSLQQDGFIPVIAPIGVGPAGETLNINADYVASAIASSLEAEKLLLLTDVEGVVGEDRKIISTLNISQIKKLKEKGIIKDGMLPKVDSCVKALEAGVRKTHIVDGRIPHCLLLEIFTEKGVGTEILKV